ncbi:MAG: hypothetical protein KAI47_08420, partial [Deltaproteobacteria bacterium]|nr:hypothetical protein [Deltaproteobacteria bacterium]
MYCKSTIPKTLTLGSHGSRAGGIARRHLGIGVFVLLALGAAACSDDAADTCPRGRGIAAVAALDATRVKVTYACHVDATTAAVVDHYSAKNLTVQPEVILALHDATTEGTSDVILTTDVQEAGVTYTLRVDGVQDAAGNTILATANFTGSGKAKTAPVTFRFDDSVKSQAKAVTLLLSVDPKTGTFSPGKNTFALDDKDGDHIWEGTLNVAVDPLRTAKTDDDGQGPEHLGYTARAVDGTAHALSELAI